MYGDGNISFALLPCHAYHIGRHGYFLMLSDANKRTVALNKKDLKLMRVVSFPMTEHDLMWDVL